MVYTIKNKSGIVILRFDSDNVRNVQPGALFDIFYDIHEINSEIILNTEEYDTEIFSGGQKRGYEDGQKEGKKYGYNEGYERGNIKGYNNGYEKGKKVGINRGKVEGYEEGYEYAWSEQEKSFFDKTGINIVPLESVQSVD